VGPTHIHIQWVPGALSLGLNLLGREADHTPPSNAEVKKLVELHFHSPNMPSWRGASLKYKENFVFTFLLGSGVHGKEISGFLKAGNFLTGCQLCKEDLLIWS
jgi:hypothetical protein